MYHFESLIHDAVRSRQEAMPVSDVAAAIGLLYEEAQAGQVVQEALLDPFFPLTAYERHYVVLLENKQRVFREGRDLLRLSTMFLRIRKDIDHYFGNRRITCVDLNGDARQEVANRQWCSLCGECCQLSGTIPDPPDSIRYPGYWYSYIAGDSPIIQRFCPFLFELPSQGLFFCAIHHVKPITCLAYGKEDCEKRHLGMAM